MVRLIRTNAYSADPREEPSLPHVEKTAGEAKPPREPPQALSRAPQRVGHYLPSVHQGCAGQLLHHVPAGACRTQLAVGRLPRTRFPPRMRGEGVACFARSRRLTGGQPTPGATIPPLPRRGRPAPKSCAAKARIRVATCSSARRARAKQPAKAAGRSAPASALLCHPSDTLSSGAAHLCRGCGRVFPYLSRR